jgi:hypothetical protein
MTFDTLSYARRLKQAGVPEAQAEAMADATRELVPADFATKPDIGAVHADIAGVKADIAAVKIDVAAVKAEVAGVKVDVAAAKAEVTGVKVDVAAVKAEVAGVKVDVAAVKTEVAAVEQRVMAAMETLGLRLTVRLGGLIAVEIAVLAAIIKL